VPAAERTITIERPVATVYAYVADGTKAREWRTAVLDVERVGGSGVESTYRQGVKGPGGRRIAADYEVYDFEADRRIAFRGIAGPVRPTGEYLFEDVPDGTRLTFALSAQLGGIKGLLLGRSVQRSMDAEMRALDRLKRILEEALPTEPGPTEAGPAEARPAEATPAAAAPVMPKPPAPAGKPRTDAASKAAKAPASKPKASVKKAAAPKAAPKRRSSRRSSP
jgi:cell division septation protein DedD